MWPEISACLKSLEDYEYRLIVTLVKKDESLEASILDSYPKAEIIYVENLGFDLGPFVYVLNQVDLDAYSYVIKLHTKRDIPADNVFDRHFSWYAGSRWRKSLLEFVSSKEKFKSVLECLETHNKIGMHGCNISSFNKFRDEHRGHREANALYAKYGLPIIKYKYVAGTMFMVKAHLMKKIVELGFKQQDFEVPDTTHEGCQMAHIFERLCGYVVYLQGYELVDCTMNVYWSKIRYILMNVKKFVQTTLFSVRVTSKNKLLFKVLRIPVLAIPLKKK